MSHSAAHNDHIGRQEACRVCASPEADLLLVLLWCSSGDFTLKVCDQVTARRLLPRYDECLRIVSARLKLCHFFSTLPVFGYSLSWQRRENPGGKPAGDPHREISTVRSRRRRALASPPRRSVPRAILYLQQDQKKKKKNQKHSPSAIDLNIFLSYKRRKLLLF